MASSQVEYRSSDGTLLRATIEDAEGETAAVLVLVHGGGVTREEGGFFRRVAEGVSARGISSLRFDMRGHGESEGKQSDLTICSAMNDLRASIEVLREKFGPRSLHVLGASFSGGIVTSYSLENQDEVASAILFNPLLDYRRRLIDEKSYWNAGKIDVESSHGRMLEQDGYVEHSPTMRIGKAMLNEIQHIKPDKMIATWKTPTLIVHGDADTFISVESSRNAARTAPPGLVELVELEGGQHGIAMPDDPGYEHPQTRAWQAQVIERCGTWILRRRDG